MLNFAINNEMAAGSDLPPFLTNNPSIKEMSVMAESNIAQSKQKHHPNYKRRKYQTEDLIGTRFGRLTIVGEIPQSSKSGGAPVRVVSCRCDCGGIIYPILTSLMAGQSKSCGCAKNERIGRLNRTHGLSNHPLYFAWKRMRQRCLSPSSKDYPDYGGRGITICQEWLDGFQPFYDWAINKWDKGLILDREDVNKDYSARNCRFINAGLSSRNQRLLRKSNQSGYRGLTKRANGKWTSAIGYRNKVIRLGTFKTRIEAAKAYDKKAIELDAGHPLNFPEDKP